MIRIRLSANDIAALRESAALAKTVVERHPMELTGQIIVVLQALVHDVDLLTNLLEEASK